jgi:hypothetical protein
MNSAANPILNVNLLPNSVSLKLDEGLLIVRLLKFTPGLIDRLNKSLFFFLIQNLRILNLRNYYI